jgi:energy-coupling factor transport system permease protein
VATLTAYLTTSRSALGTRTLHPLAWWLWALGLAAAASRTTNPLLLAVILAVTVLVAVARRPQTPWAAAFSLYLWAGAIIVALRVLFRVIFAGNEGGVVLLQLPQVQLPPVTGLTLLGDVTAESLLSGVYDGLRLATMLICLGAANALANPRRLLRILPAALHEVSTAVVVALSVFPQLAESVGRVRRARRLRPSLPAGRVAGLRSLVVPVLEDALDRSLLLAASMDARGYGRHGARSALPGQISSGLLLGGLCGLAVGSYALLDATVPRYLGWPFLLAGLTVGVGGLTLSGRGVVRSAYRPDRWSWAESAAAASGLLTACLVLVSGHLDPRVINPAVDPLRWPQVTPLAMVAALVGLLPLLVTRAAPGDAGGRG